MINEVVLHGITHSPSDHEALDGDLGTCLNLIPENSALCPIYKGSEAESFQMPNDTCSIVLVHKVTHDADIHSHYIVHCTNASPYPWYWTERKGDGTPHQIDLGDFHVNAVTAVGNILCFVGNEKTIYAFWKEGIYNILDFSTIKYSATCNRLEGNKTYDVIEQNDAVQSIDDHHSDKDDRYIKFKDTLDAKAAQKLFSAKDAYLNKKMDDESFKYIQFGVLAIKLYDGSYIQIGNPFPITNGEGIDNNINLWYTYSSGSFNVTGEGEKFTYAENTCYAIHLAQSLYKFNLTINFDEISKYEDLITGVDVFVSNSIYPYKTNVEITEKQKKAQGDSSADPSSQLEINTEEYGKLILRNIYIMGAIECLGHWEYPPMTQDELNEAISNLVFYKSVSFSYDDIKNKKKKNLKRILQTEDHISLAVSLRESYGSKCAITYNNRLHLGNVSITMDSATNGLVSDKVSKAKIITHVKYKYNGLTQETYSIDDQGYPLNPMLAFPSTYVTLLEIYASYNGNYKHKAYQPYNEGNIGFSYYVEYEKGKLKDIDLDNADDITSSEWDDIYKKAQRFKQTPINSKSLVKVSEVENPLVFPAKNSVQVGSSIISAMATNTQPISEGQFGYAPLYAFTDEGVWVLSVNDQGTYESRQPAKRDICSNPKGILQIDDAVLFPTEQGVIMQTGRESKCITDSLDGYPFDFTHLPVADKILAKAGIEATKVQYLNFREFMKSADMVYDYYDSRIILFSPICGYAYVYSLKSGRWGMMESNLTKRVNIYPDAYAIDADRRIINVYQPHPDADTPYIFCTRPLGLDAPEIHKTVFSIIARGYFRKSHLAQVLYASNDLFNWHAVGSSVDRYLRGLAGSPYKYFRIAAIGSLSKEESIQGFSIDYQQRWNNKLR